MVKRTGNPFKDAILIDLHGVGAEQITCEDRIITCVYAGQQHSMVYSLTPAPGSVGSPVEALRFIGAVQSKASE